MSNDGKEPSARKRVFDKFEEELTQHDDEIITNFLTFGTALAHLSCGFCTEKNYLGQPRCDKLRKELIDSMRRIVEVNELRSEQLLTAGEEESVISCSDLAGFLRVDLPYSPELAPAAESLADIFNKLASC